jgi:predicted alpha/beta superfamily hydrolase
MCAMAVGAPLAAQTLSPAPEIVLPALSGERFILNSEAIPGRRYHVHVRLPPDYADHPDRRYPVVYLLDGDSLLPMLAPLHLFMTYEDRVPEVIMVGIGYGTFGEGNRRSDDYHIPLPGGAVPDGGGAPAFARVLNEELVPQIDARFRTNPEQRILMGQSMGGQFVLWSAWNEPDAWYARMVSNASLGDAAAYFENWPTERQSTRRSTARGSILLYASGTADRPRLRAEALAFRQRWQYQRDLPFGFEWTDIPGGTHGAEAGRVYRWAMRMLYAPWVNESTP